MPAPTPVLELGDDRVFVRPPTADELRALDAVLAETRTTAAVLTSFTVVLVICLVAWPGLLLAAVILGMGAMLVVMWRRVDERRRDRAEQIVEVRSARRTLRVLGSGRLFAAAEVQEYEVE